MKKIKNFLSDFFIELDNFIEFFFETPFGVFISIFIAILAFAYVFISGNDNDV